VGEGVWVVWDDDQVNDLYRTGGRKKLRTLRLGGDGNWKRGSNKTRVNRKTN
jgi:hypothetical protein